MLLIKATEDCETIPESEITFDETDDTLLQVIIRVDDINDNAPQFTSKIFTGGVTTEADFGTQFMHVKVNSHLFSKNTLISFCVIKRSHRCAFYSII